MRIITITGYRRPHLFRRMLESLVAGDIDGWRILIQIEPSERAEAFKTIAAELLAGANYSLCVNETILGVRENPYKLVERAFAEGADTLLYLEEDLLLAPDVTALAEWYAENHRPQWLCLCLLSGGCGSGGFISSPSLNDLLFESKSFNSLGFVCRREEWERHLRGVWMKHVGWDWAVYFHLMRSKKLVALQPVAARSTHTGRDEGSHAKPEWHDLVFSGLELAAEAPAGRRYRVVPVERLPAELKRHALLWEQYNETLLKKSDKTWENTLLSARVETLQKENELLKKKLQEREDASFWKRMLLTMRPKQDKNPTGGREA